MRTVADLRAFAEQKLYEGDHATALHVYAALCRLQPTGLDQRLRVGDALLALGRVQEAATVYTVLARHAANAGYPLYALVALKILEALEPELGRLLGQLAPLYAAGSARLGRGARLSLGDASAPLPPDLRLHAPASLDDLVSAATAIATSVEGIAAYPAVLPPIPLFSELPPDAFAAVLSAMKLVRLRPGDVVIQQGEPGQAFYVVARGAVGVSRVDGAGQVHALATLHAGALFGEMALVSAQPRTATVAAETDADVLEFDRTALVAAADSVGVLAVALDKFTRERLLHNLLATSRFFQPLDRTQRLDLARRFVAHDVPAGMDLIREGEPGQGLFVLLSGEVDVWKRDGDQKVLLATLRPGDVFGEIALVLEGPTTASVTAATECTVLFLARELFQRLVAAIPEIRAYVETLGDERMMDTRLVLSGTHVEEELSDEDVELL